MHTLWVREHNRIAKQVRRATKSRFGMFEPCPLSSMIFLKPW